MKFRIGHILLFISFMNFEMKIFGADESLRKHRTAHPQIQRDQEKKEASDRAAIRATAAREQEARSEKEARAQESSERYQRQQRKNARIYGQQLFSILFLISVQKQEMILKAKYSR